MEQPQPQHRARDFDDLLDQVRSRLLPALVAKWGVEVGSDVCSEVEEYAWEHQSKVLRMESQLGYLYRVAQSKARRYTRWSKRSSFPSRFSDIIHEDTSVHDVLQHLSVLNDDQRVCVLLVHAYGWTYAEVADLLGVSRASVNHHVHRGLAHLRGTEFRDSLLDIEARRTNTPSEETR